MSYGCQTTFTAIATGYQTVPDTTNLEDPSDVYAKAKFSYIPNCDKLKYKIYVYNLGVNILTDASIYLGPPGFVGSEIVSLDIGTNCVSGFPDVPGFPAGKVQAGKVQARSPRNAQKSCNKKCPSDVDHPVVLEGYITVEDLSGLLLGVVFKTFYREILAKNTFLNLFLNDSEFVSIRGQIYQNCC